jgi:hypothetical protein
MIPFLGIDVNSSGICVYSIFSRSLESTAAGWVRLSIGFICALEVVVGPPERLKSKIGKSKVGWCSGGTGDTLCILAFHR